MKMTTEEAFVKTLQRHGIKHAFGIIGSAMMPISDLFPKAGITFWDCAHEGSAGMMADGYTRATGRMSMMIAQNGPGITNFVTAVKTAYWNHTPLLLVTPQAANKTIGQGGFQEVEQMKLFEDMVAYQEEVRDPSRMAEVLARVISKAKQLSAPAQINIPRDYWTHVIDIELPTALEFERSPGGENSVAHAAEMLSAAKNPVILNGAGVVLSEGGIAASKALAERLEAPVVLTYKGKAVFPDEHDLMGGVLCGGTGTATKELIADADAALGVGTDLDAVSMQHWSIEVPEDLVHVTLGADDIGTGYDPAVGIVADAAETLDALDAALAEASIASETGLERAADARAAVNDRLEELRTVTEPPLTSVATLDAIRAGTPRDAVVALDAGGFRLWALVAFPAYEARDWVTPGSWATMGSGVPSAIGAKLANPEQDVVALTGDGGVLMCLHELHTLADEDIDVTVVVLNNSDYAIISEEAGRSYRMDEGEYGWEGTPVSYTTVAEGLGLDVERAETPAEIEATVADAIENEGPTVVEIPTDPYEPQSGVWMNE